MYFPDGGITGAVYIADLPDFNKEMRNIQLLGEALSDMTDSLEATSGTDSFHNAFIDFVNVNKVSNGNSLEILTLETLLSLSLIHI